MSDAPAPQPDPLPYWLDVAAEADLEDIIVYTMTQWGEEQVRRYQAELKACLLALSERRGAVRALADIHPDLAMKRCGHHYAIALFGQVGRSPVRIMALLHERRDVMAWVRRRMEGMQ